MKKTILYDEHVSLGAMMAPFGGYEMPIRYGGIIREHAATREAVTIFDTCHMGEFAIRGPKAAADLEMLLSCAVGTIKIGRCRYGFLCNERGGVKDDQILYRTAPEEFFMVVNASTEPADFEWVRGHLSSGTEIENLSQRTAKLDVQGPGSVKIVSKLMEHPIDDLNYYAWMWNRYRGKEALVSRTGYTGEIGFEIYCAVEPGKAFWRDALELGAVPAGLGARDTLRLEMGYPLYGHELDEETNAAESGFSRAIDGGKKFIGSDAVLDPSKKRKLLVAVSIEGRKAARRGDTIHDTSGAAVGTVSSGSFSPSLSRAIALGYVALPSSGIGTPLTIRTERQELAGTVVEPPFYKNGTARADSRKFL